MCWSSRPSNPDRNKGTYCNRLILRPQDPPTCTFRTEFYRQFISVARVVRRQATFGSGTLSPCKHRLFVLPNEAEIICQVTAAVMRSAGLEDHLAGAISELPKQP